MDDVPAGIQSSNTLCNLKLKGKFILKQAYRRE
jgi:hypothetical protein